MQQYRAQPQCWPRQASHGSGSKPVWQRGSIAYEKNRRDQKLLLQEGAFEKPMAIAECLTRSARYQHSRLHSRRATTRRSRSPGPPIGRLTMPTGKSALVSIAFAVGIVTFGTITVFVPETGWKGFHVMFVLLAARVMEGLFGAALVSAHRVPVYELPACFTACCLPFSSSLSCYLSQDWGVGERGLGRFILTPRVRNII